MTNNGINLYDYFKGTHVLKTKLFLDESQHWDLDKLHSYQEDKIKILLKAANKDVPFYRDMGATVGFGDFNSFPISDREMAMEAGDRLLSDSINFKKCKIGRTGGTTGPPLRIYRDTETRSFSLAAYYRFYDWMGIEPGMPEVELWGEVDIRNSKSWRTALINRIYNFRSYNAFSFNEDLLGVVVKKLQRFQPKLIRGYLSAILLLADYIKRNNIKGVAPLALSSTTETLFPEYRKLIEEVFQAPIFNQYGCGECNSIAFECSAHKGMHIAMEHCVLEQDEDNNLMVTNLDNLSQPFIRYRNGDKGIITHEACSCGNKGPRLIEIHGRVNENIILKDDASVNGIFFANLLDQSGFINSNKMLRFQVVQNKRGEIAFKAEVKAKLDSADIRKLEDAFMPFFNLVEISQHNFLDPGPSGKFRYLISNLKRDPGLT